MKKAFFLFAILLIFNSVMAQTKKGPPNLSGDWVLKEDSNCKDCTVKRHYTCRQVGNDVTFQCTDAGQTDRTYNFSWDAPGTYVLLGTEGFKFDKTNFSRTIRQILNIERGESFKSNGYILQINDDHNLNTIVSYSLCETNFFTVDAKFQVLEKTLDEIEIRTKGVTIEAPEIHFQRTESAIEEIIARPDPSHCARISRQHAYFYSGVLVRVKDSW